LKPSGRRAPTREKLYLTYAYVCIRRAGTFGPKSWDFEKDQFTPMPHMDTGVSSEKKLRQQ
jgi:hypothetical protein